MSGYFPLASFLSHRYCHKLKSSVTCALGDSKEVTVEDIETLFRKIM